MTADSGEMRMNMKIKFKKLTMAGALLLGYAGIASAHDVTNQPIGATLSATDYFQVSCFDDGTGNAVRLDIQVNDDTAGASILSLQVKKGLLAKNTTDATGANGAYSPLVSLQPPVGQGNGVYDVLVDKTTAAARQYDIKYHCMTSDNLHTGTSISQKQNQ
jgi:hypothetical protein